MLHLRDLLHIRYGQQERTEQSEYIGMDDTIVTGDKLYVVTSDSRVIIAKVTGVVRDTVYMSEGKRIWDYRYSLSDGRGWTGKLWHWQVVEQSTIWRNMPDSIRSSYLAKAV